MTPTRASRTLTISILDSTPLSCPLKAEHLQPVPPSVHLSSASPVSPLNLRPLTLALHLLSDGSEPGAGAYSQLLVLRELVHSLDWEANEDDSQDNTPSLLCKYFDVISGSGMGGFFAILATVIQMSISDMMAVNKSLNDHLFSLPSWSGQHIDKERNLSILQNILHEELANHAHVLYSPFCPRQPRVGCRGFICTTNPQLLKHPRVFSTHPCGTRTMDFTVLQALILSISDSRHLPPVALEDIEFIGAAHPWSNPTQATVSHMTRSFRGDPSMASIISIGYHTDQSLTLDQPGQVLWDCEAQAEHWSHRCPEGLFYRLSVPLGHIDLRSVNTATHAYLLEHDFLEILDNAVNNLSIRQEGINLKTLDSFRETASARRDVQKEIQALNENQQDQNVSKIRRWLYPQNTTLDTLSRLRNTRTPGTGKWFTESAIFTSWLAEGPSQMFVLVGNPGTGKTYMSQLVFDTLCERGNCVTLTHFIKHGSTCIEDVLVSLLIQTYQTTDNISSEISHMYQMRQKPLRSDLQKALMHRMAFLDLVFIVLDALDEIHVDEQPVLITILRKLGHNVRLFVTARPLNDVYGTPPPMRHDLPQSNEHDIQSFVSEWVDRDHAFLRDQGSLREEIRTTVVVRSASLFLLASLHISRLSSCRAPRDVRQELKSLPNTPEERYQDTLNRIRIGKPTPRDYDRALAAFQWILFARMAFTLPMLVDAVASFSLQEPCDRVEDSRIDGGLLLNICGGLLTVVKEDVVFVHLTVIDFFRKQESSLFGNDPQSKLANACILYMIPTLPTLPHLREQYQSGGRRRNFLMIPGFMEYCLSHADDHVEQAQKKPKDDVLSSFLQQWTVYNRWQKWHPMKKPRVSPLHWLIAIRWNPGHDHSSMSSATQLIQKLAQYFNHQDSRDGAGTPLYEAISARRVEMVALLLKQPGVDPNLRCVSTSRNRGEFRETHSTPLTLAVSRRDAASVKLLLETPLVDPTRPEYRLFNGHRGVLELEDTPLDLANTQEAADDIVAMLTEHSQMDRVSKSRRKDQLVRR